MQPPCFHKRLGQGNCIDRDLHDGEPLSVAPSFLGNVPCIAVATGQGNAATHRHSITTIAGGSEVARMSIPPAPDDLRHPILEYRFRWKNYRLENLDSRAKTQTLPPR